MYMKDSVSIRVKTLIILKLCLKINHGSMSMVEN